MKRRKANLDLNFFNKKKSGFLTKCRLHTRYGKEKSFQHWNFIHNIRGRVTLMGKLMNKLVYHLQCRFC